MKLLIIAGLLAVTTQAHTQPVIDFRPLDPSDSKDRELLAAKRKAIEVLDRIVSELQQERNPAFLKSMKSALEIYPATKSTEYTKGTLCDTEDVMAYVPHLPSFKPVIRLCMSRIELMDFDAVVQVFIHESVHLAEGIAGDYTGALEAEARAMKVEINVMKMYRGCSYIDYSYIDDPRYKAVLSREKIVMLPACSTQRGQGPNNSFKPKPLRGSA